MTTSRRSRSNSREHAAGVEKEAEGSALGTPTTDEETDDTASARAADRLPRTLRAMERRFDRQQTASTAAISALQGEMTKISEMMAWMTTNFAPPTPENKGTTPVNTQAHTFSTPPPLPSHSLSPIFEHPTPT